MCLGALTQNNTEEEGGPTRHLIKLVGREVSGWIACGSPICKLEGGGLFTYPKLVMRGEVGKLTTIDNCTYICRANVAPQDGKWIMFGVVT